MPNKTYVPNALKINELWARNIVEILNREECRIVDKNKFTTFDGHKSLECWIFVNDETRPLLIKAGALIPLRAI